MQTSNNSVRYRTLAGTIICQFGLGSVYTWSLFNAALSHKLGAPVTKVAFTFGLLSLTLAIASSLSSKMQERFGVRRVALGAGLALGIGLFLTSMASSLTMLYLSAGVLVGLADGAGYLLTLSNCVKWFPERKGMASAFSLGAYGLGSLGFKYINLGLMGHMGLDGAFRIWAVLALVLVMLGALLLSDAPRQQAAGVAKGGGRDFSLAEALRKPQYWGLALMFLTACMSGLYVIGVAKDIGERYAHLPAMVAANSVAVIAVANLLGRLVLGILSDRMSRSAVISMALSCALIGILILLYVPLNAPLFFIAVACIAFSFGGSITVYPALVSDFFGLTNLARTYGVIYLGFGFGSVVGSIISSAFGGFLATFYLILALLIVSLICSVMVRPRAAMA
ncbi:OFA family MFS transporter [Paludibacterium yongneupense]|uniref:OFA family MFS transporter n=1 Tax=Paludibacterium yongneupense TaxID=400061 RepID=UPI0003F89F1E|nr:OFA family MFS transporter [Paludibacterium yongneupense]